MEKASSPWCVPVAVEDIPETGLHMEIAAPAAVREEIAALADLRDLPQLSAVFDLTPQGTGVHVCGQVAALVGQTCVVSLEPIESEVSEPVDLRFAPMPDGAAAQLAKDRKKPRGREEPPEPLVDGQIDLGALATEFLILGLDPYPRKTGVQFASPKVEDAGERPFAALEVLKKRLGGNRS